MIQLYANIILFGLAAAFGAATIALMLIFLQQRGYLKLAIAVLLGMVLMQFLQAIMFRNLPRMQDMVNATGSGVVARPILLSLIGAAMLAGAWMQLRGDRSDQMIKRLNELLPRIGFFAAFGIGMLLVLTSVKIWALSLAAIDTAREYTNSDSSIAVSYSVYVVVAQILLLTFVLAQLIAPQKSSAVLDRLGGWLTRNARYVIAGVTGVLGLYFFVHGVTSLFQ